jgi:N-acetylglucosaminyl-diphospho-decaprenol L-rhamnosyltransferase
VAILIVSFRNPQDVCGCLNAISRATNETNFDIFICENGGHEAYQELAKLLAGPQGPCIAVSDDRSKSPMLPAGRLVEVTSFALKGRSSLVWLGCAARNLGYAGGVNVWIERLQHVPSWEGYWILNPDSEPEPAALDALVRRAITGNKGMVGSTILPSNDRNHIHCRGGHHWHKLMTQFVIIGSREPVNAPIDLTRIESAIDCISGASLYITRACLAKIGLMDERFFLYYEDADWSMRARKCGLGYASFSIVPHMGGTTIGSSKHRAQRSWLSVYLGSRNRIHFVRMYFHRFLPLATMMGFIHAVEYLFAGSPKNFKAALDGLLAGLRGETGMPPNSVN